MRSTSLQNLSKRLDRIDWPQLDAAVDLEGHARTPGLLDYG